MEDNNFYTFREKQCFSQKLINLAEIWHRVDHAQFFPYFSSVINAELKICG